MSTDEMDWNPSIVTPSGEPVEIEATDDDRPWRDPVKLRNAVEEGLTDEQMAAMWGISESQVRKYRLRNDITRRGDPDRDRTFEHDPRTNVATANAGGGMAYHEPDGEILEDLDDREDFDCPECGMEHTTPGGQHDCLRRHARMRCERLQQMADEGSELLPVGAIPEGPDE